MVERAGQFILRPRPCLFSSLVIDSAEKRKRPWVRAGRHLWRWKQLLRQETLTSFPDCSFHPHIRDGVIAWGSAHMDETGKERLIRFLFSNHIYNIFHSWVSKGLATFKVTPLKIPPLAAEVSEHWKFLAPRPPKLFLSTYKTGERRFAFCLRRLSDDLIFRFSRGRSVEIVEIMEQQHVSENKH